LCLIIINRTLNSHAKVQANIKRIESSSQKLVSLELASRNWRGKFPGFFITTNINWSLIFKILKIQFFFHTDWSSNIFFNLWNKKMKFLSFILGFLLLHCFSFVLSNPVDKAEKRHNVKSSSNSPDNNVDPNVFLKTNDLKGSDEGNPLQSACVTRECIGASYRILNHIDTSADPCDNFYKVLLLLLL